MPMSVERMSALIGLKARLLYGWSQIAERMCSGAGAVRPTAPNASDSAHTRGVSAPSSPPSGKRSPSTWRTTPGAGGSAAGYTTHPPTRAAPAPIAQIFVVPTALPY